MQKQLLLTILLFFSLGFSAHAQPYYFLQDSMAYQPLTNPTSINNGSVWGSFTNYSVPLWFGFEYMDTTFYQVKLEGTGRLIFDSGHYFYLDGFSIIDMQDRGSGTSLSPLSYEVTGASGSQILKIEVSEATLSTDTSARISFQIWLYEGTSRIETHMGPTSISNMGAITQGPFSGLFKVDSWSPLSFGYGHSLHGNPVAPADTAYSGMVSSSGFKLNQAPNEGQVYVFTTDTSSMTGREPVFAETRVQVFPNPATETLEVQTEAGLERMELWDLKGSFLAEVPVNQSFSVAGFPRGVYLLLGRDKNDGIVHREKVVFR